MGEVPAGSGGLSGSVGGLVCGFGPPRLEGSCGRQIGSGSGLRVMLAGLRTVDWLRVERAGTWFRSGGWGPTDSGIEAKVLPPSGLRAEVRFRTVSKSAVLVRWRLWVEVSELLRGPGEGPGIRGGFRAGAGSPVPAMLKEASVVSTAPRAPGLPGAESG